MRFMLQKASVALLLMATASASWADAVQKIGFMDAERVYRESKDAQQINNKLQKEFSSQFEQLQRLEVQGFELQKKMLTVRMSEQERQRQQAKMASLNKQYLELKRTTDEEYQLRRNEEFASMQIKANKALVELAKQGNYDVIVKDVVYVRSEFDITDQLIQILNRR
ncbi:hypothetical protein ADP71_00930 [Vitreoscilla sp. C1]|nr:OmpH family outer membrane protein [Vitreoscilla sp. C1]AUZ03937.2 hypothetical protein ADP71_00930 [Vitreoscilla sp. C1]